MGLRQKRFDIAGAHPDEVYGAVADLVRAVDQVGDQWAHVEGFPRDLRLGSCAVAADAADAVRGR